MVTKLITHIMALLLVCFKYRALPRVLVLVFQSEVIYSVVDGLIDWFSLDNWIICVKTFHDLNGKDLALT